MERRLFPRSLLTRKRAGFLAGAAAVALSLAPLTTAALGKLKLPAERTSPTGNFFTLEAYVAPTSSKRVANFEMKVCTSAHTPAYTAIEPSFFTLSLAQGGTVAESIAVAKSPAVVAEAAQAAAVHRRMARFLRSEGQDRFDARIRVQREDLLARRLGGAHRAHPRRSSQPRLSSKLSSRISELSTFSTV